MDVQVDGDLIRLERARRAWSQEHLAEAASIGVRTIQRIEATGVASYESVRAISAVLEIPLGVLQAEDGSPSQAPSVGVAPGGTRSSEVGRAPMPRLRFEVRWPGAVLALALIVGTTGFLLLEDYKKVRVLRTLEHWVTSQAEPPAAPANRPDSG